MSNICHTSYNYNSGEGCDSVDKTTSKKLQLFSHKVVKKSKQSYFGTGTDSVYDLVTYAESMACNPLIYPETNSMRGMRAISRSDGFRAKTDKNSVEANLIFYRLNVDFQSE